MIIEYRTVQTGDLARWLADGWQVVASWTGDPRWTQVWRAIK